MPALIRGRGPAKRETRGGVRMEYRVVVEVVIVFAMSRLGGC